MGLSAKEISAILKTARSLGVAEIEIDGLKVKFDTSAVSVKSPRKKDREADLKEKEDNQKLIEEALKAELMISDPVAYERQFVINDHAA